MKITKLNDEFFYDFASEALGLDVGLYRHDLELLRSDKVIKLKLYLGGESEDCRKFLFRDEKCVFRNCSHNQQDRDISYDWVKYVVKYANELSNADKQEIVNKYNNNIEHDIKQYAEQRRGSLI